MISLGIGHYLSRLVAGMATSLGSGSEACEVMPPPVDIRCSLQDSGATPPGYSVVYGNSLTRS
jgi:hypothetical protein